MVLCVRGCDHLEVERRRDLFIIVDIGLEWFVIEMRALSIWSKVVQLSVVGGSVQGGQMIPLHWLAKVEAHPFGEFPAKQGGGLHFGTGKAFRISCWLVVSIPIVTSVAGISVVALNRETSRCAIIQRGCQGDH